MSLKGKKEKEFMTLYEPVHDRFERFCKARVYGDMNYKDLMHDTIVIAYEKFDTLKKSEAFLHFLFGITIRILANSNRKQKPDKLRDHQEVMHIEDHSSRADRNDNVNLLHAALARLPEEQREALVLFEITGFSIKEIAELQGSGESAVKQRLSRGRHRLLQLLSSESIQTEKEVRL